MPLTPEERQILLQPLPLRTAVYAGAIWAGVQVTDLFMREIAEDVLLSFSDNEYGGIYANVAELELERTAWPTVSDE